MRKFILEKISPEEEKIIAAHIQELDKDVEEFEALQKLSQRIQGYLTSLLKNPLSKEEESYIKEIELNLSQMTTGCQNLLEQLNLIIEEI